MVGFEGKSKQEQEQQTVQAFNFIDSSFENHQLTAMFLNSYVNCFIQRDGCSKLESEHKKRKKKNIRFFFVYFSFLILTGRKVRPGQFSEDGFPSKDGKTFTHVIIITIIIIIVI